MDPSALIVNHLHVVISLSFGDNCGFLCDRKRIVLKIQISFCLEWP